MVSAPLRSKRTWGIRRAQVTSSRLPKITWLTRGMANSKSISSSVSLFFRAIPAYFAQRFELQDTSQKHRTPGTCPRNSYPIEIEVSLFVTKETCLPGNHGDNAGIAKNMPLAEVTPETFTKQYTINVRTSFPSPYFLF